MYVYISMDSGLIKAFQKVKYRPESKLSDDILLTILKKERKNTHIKLWAYSIVGVFSLTGVIPAFNLLLSNFIQSGFYQYLLLAFSDSQAVLYWKEITLSIIESIPMTSLILFLVLVFIFILSLRFIARNIRVRSNLSIA
jgi:hypothetical protein